MYREYTELFIDGETLLSIALKYKGVWFTNDATGGSHLYQLCGWWDRFNNLRLTFGYLANPSKDHKRNPSAKSVCQHWSQHQYWWNEDLGVDLPFAQNPLL